MKEFTGTERYRVVRRLGKGGMGEVYEVHDIHRELNVALKTLNLHSREGAEALKREFRAVADLRHPHLITLYDLVVTREHAFFTMEIVSGHDLATYVRPFSEPTTGRFSASQTLGYDPKRLLLALPQVLAGLDALHRAGFVHRDLKPANILVSHDGTAKILDFGIAQAFHDFTFEDGSEAVGTPQYMSPEQAFGRRAGPEADLYALGCILFVLLTGRYPFDFEEDIDILKAQAHQKPTPPRAIIPQIPPPLEALCLSLMEKEPEKRPSAKKAVEYLVARMGAKEPFWYQPKAPTEVSFVGREAELQAILDAAIAVEQNREARVILVGGDSGIGKSLLVDEATRLLRTRSTRWGHYASRCYEREDLPYKAFDGVMEAIAMTLEKRPKHEVHAFLPKGIEALARIFPVLWEVSAIAEIPVLKSQDRRAERDRAFLAFREILCRLAKIRPLCLVLDDLQWADPESGQLLLSITSGPQAPPILILATARTSEIGPDHPIAPFVENSSKNKNVRLELRLFGKREISSLWQYYTHQTPQPAVIQGVLQESHRIPYLAVELIRSCVESPTGDALNLTAVLHNRISRLSPEARAVLDCAAIAGGLCSFRLLKTATGISSAMLVRTLDELLEARLIREAYHPHQDEVYDVYHNRIRELVYQQTRNDRRKAFHNAIAKTLEIFQKQEGKEQDFDRLAYHCGRAGDVSKALSYSLQAASHAVEKLAFGHAADLYAKTLSFAESDPSIDKRPIHEARAEVLDFAGRYREASGEFTNAARQYDGLERAHLVLRAAEADLKAGDLGRGIEGLNAILSAVDGQHIKKSTAKTLLSIVRHKWEGEVRARFFQSEKSRAPTPEEALRLELYHRLAIHYFVFDIFRGAEYQEKLFVHALRIGDPTWVAKAFYSHGVFLASSFNARYMKDAVRFLQLGDQLKQQKNIQDPFVGYVSLAAWAVYYLCDNQWDKCLDCFQYAVENHEHEIEKRSFERAVAHSYAARTEFYAGLLDKADQRLRTELSRARERGDRYALSELAWPRMRVALYRGNLTHACTARDESLSIWPKEPHSMQRLRMESAAGEIALAEGNLEEARHILEQLLKNGKQNSLAYLKWDHAEVSLLLARTLCALAKQEVHHSTRKTHLDKADSLLKSPLSLPKRFLFALALRQRAVIDHLRQKPRQALANLDKAMPIFLEVKGKVEEAAARLLRYRVKQELGQEDDTQDKETGLRLLQEAGAWDPAEREGGAWSWK